MDSPDECSLFLPFVDHVLALSTIWRYLIVLRAGIHYGAFGRKTDCGASRRPYTADSKHVDVREIRAASSVHGTIVQRRQAYWQALRVPKERTQE